MDSPSVPSGAGRGHPAPWLSRQGARRPMIAIKAGAFAVEESQSDDIVLRAGEISVQDMALLHSSGANRSSSPRIGFIVRFSTPEIKATSYPMIRAGGCRAYEYLTFWDAPADNDLDRGLRGREALLAALGRDR